MYFAGAGVADHADNLARRGATDHAIVYQHDALAFQKMPDGIELELDAEIADGLRRLDEGTSYIMISD